MQTGAKSAADGFNRFVEGDSAAKPQSGRSPTSVHPDADKADFWESFGQEKHVPQHKKNTASLSKKEENFWESFGQSPQAPSVEKQDFWDSFAAAGEVSMVEREKQNKAGGSIGTSAMKGGGGAAAGRKSDEWGGDW